jgi:AcrR family transcriptional regulator
VPRYIDGCEKQPAWRLAALLVFRSSFPSLGNEEGWEVSYTFLVGNAVKKQVTEPASRDREKTKDALLRVAIAAIEEVGEAHVRLDDILRDADASVSSLYHHYGNMRGLLDEAQLARFDAETGENIKDFHDAVLKVRNKEEFKVVVRGAIHDAYSRSRAHNRSIAMSAFGSIFETPDYNARVVELEKSNIDLLARALTHAKAQGLTRPDLDVEGLSAWVMGLKFSRVIPDILDDDAVADSWLEMTTQALNHLLGL